MKDMDVRQALVMAESMGADTVALRACATREEKIRLVLGWLERAADPDAQIVHWAIVLGIAANALWGLGADPEEALAGAKMGIEAARGPVPSA